MLILVRGSSEKNLPLVGCCQRSATYRRMGIFIVRNLLSIKQPILPPHALDLRPPYRYGTLTASLVSTLAKQYNTQRLDQNFQIQIERPVIDVMQVEASHIIKSIDV